jgi:hypothetical protein
MPRPVYTTFAQVTAEIPADFATEALDDDKDGVADEAVWIAVTENAANQVDARIGKRYPTPLDPEDLPAAATQASLLFVLESLYRRRGFGTEETNPFLVSARAARKDLDRIGDGESPLTPAAQAPKRSVMTFTEPSRTHNSAGNLSA